MYKQLINGEDQLRQQPPVRRVEFVSETSIDAERFALAFCGPALTPSQLETREIIR